MKALVYHGPGAKAWEDVAQPELAADTDAIVPLRLMVDSGAKIGEALAMGLVDQVCTPAALGPTARAPASTLAGGDPIAFRSIKALARDAALPAMVAEEERSITEFVEIWYSGRTRDNLAKIVIRNDS